MHPPKKSFIIGFSSQKPMSFRGLANLKPTSFHPAEAEALCGRRFLQVRFWGGRALLNLAAAQRLFGCLAKGKTTDLRFLVQKKTCGFSLEKMDKQTSTVIMPAISPWWPMVKMYCFHEDRCIQKIKDFLDGCGCLGWRGSLSWRRVLAPASSYSNRSYGIAITQSKQKQFILYNKNATLTS